MYWSTDFSPYVGRVAAAKTNAYRHKMDVKEHGGEARGVERRGDGGGEDHAHE